ncbi:MAG: DUF4163 domain-containing protein [Erythrobacter sp.]|nr:DUF4163 domain-containing protein [Erythrobacter sp.]
MALTISLAVAGCSSPEDVAADVGTAEATASTSTTITTTATADAATGSAAATTLEDNAEKAGGKREFAYSWPAAVSAIPALVERFSAERDTALAEQKAEWNEALTEFAGQDCISCTSRDFAKQWKVVANLPRYLSLSADMYFYTGGAHGNSDFDGLVWDREARAAIAPAAMFRSEEDLQAALHGPWCKALKAERTKRLGADSDDDEIFPCPDIAQLTLLLGSSNKQTFNRIGLIAAPYVAGSYAEGPYEVTLPVAPKVLAAVKPEYKPAFALTK